MSISKLMIGLVGPLCALSVGLPPTPAGAIDYPTRDITVVVPFRPGGGSDVIARAAAPFLRKYLPKQVNILTQNIDAAGGRAGTFKVFDARPDGYTIGLLEPYTFALAETMGEAGARTSTKLTWMQTVSSTPFMIAVNAAGPIKTLQDLKGRKVRAAATQPSLVTSMAVLTALGAELQPVMYGGGAECALATLRGDTDITVQMASTIARQSEASGGKLVPLAALGEKRFPDAPNVPTVKELGGSLPADVAPLLRYDYIYAGPPGLPAEISKIFTDAIEKTVADPEFVAILAKAKLPILYTSGQESQATIARLTSLIAAHKAAVRKTLEK